MDDKPHYLEHRKRLRERFNRGGPGALHDYESLELLLTYAIPRVDVKPVAKALLKRYGGLAGVLDASQAELESVSGLGAASATLIRLVKEMCGAYLREGVARRDVLAAPDAVVNFARVQIAGLPHEAFMVIFLNTKNELIDVEVVQEGTIDRATIYPRRVIEAALSRHASSLILVHNHPSGHPDPSAEDKVMTKAIVNAARTMDIKVLDHIIVGRRGHFSFAENRLM